MWFLGFWVGNGGNPLNTYSRSDCNFIRFSIAIRCGEFLVRGRATKVKFYMFYGLMMSYLIFPVVANLQLQYGNIFSSAEQACQDKPHQVPLWWDTFPEHPDPSFCQEYRPSLDDRLHISSAFSVNLLRNRIQIDQVATDTWKTSTSGCGHHGIPEISFFHCNLFYF